MNFEDDMELEEILGNIDNYSLIEELAARHLTKKQKDEIKRILTCETHFIASNIDEEMKLCLFKEYINKYKFTELRELFENKK